MIYTSEIKGLDELIKAFNELPEEALVFVEQKSLPPAETIKNRAKAYVAKYNKYSDKGNLLKALKVNKPSTKRKYKYYVYSKVWFDKGGAHGVPLELGHRIVRKGKTIGTVKEHPFLRPAADESRGEVIEAMTEAINTALDKMGGLK